MKLNVKRSGFIQVVIYRYLNINQNTQKIKYMYSKTCVKRPLINKQNKDLNDKWQLNEGQKYCRMLPLEHSAMLLISIEQ